MSARGFRLNPLELVGKIMLPAAAPHLFVGLHSGGAGFLLDWLIVFVAHLAALLTAGDATCNRCRP